MRPPGLQILLFFIILVLVTFDAINNEIPTLLHPPLPVLLIHQVGPPVSPMDFWSIPRKQFVAILEMLKRKGFFTVTRKELINYVLAGEDLPHRRSVALTFDDGYLSHSDFVLPELKRNGYTGLFFVNSARKRPCYILSLSGLAPLASVGSIDSHAREHRSLLRRPDESPARYEYRLSLMLDEYRSFLARHTGSEVKLLAYPNGEFDIPLAKRARRAGYLLAFTTEYGYVTPNSDPMTLPRFMIMKSTSNREVEDFLEQNVNWAAYALLFEILLSLLLICKLVVLIKTGQKQR